MSASPAAASASSPTSGVRVPQPGSGTGQPSGARPGRERRLPRRRHRAHPAGEQGQLRPHDLPAFQIDIVSTDTATCTIDTGPEALRVVVMHGSQVAWNSGACLHGASPHVISLRRGVPVVMSIAWNRHLTVTGCPPTIMAATNRTYMAVAQAAGAQSPWQSFRLTGSATARQAEDGEQADVRRRQVSAAATAGAADSRRPGFSRRAPP